MATNLGTERYPSRRPVDVTVPQAIAPGVYPAFDRDLVVGLAVAGRVSAAVPLRACLSQNSTLRGTLYPAISELKTSGRVSGVLQGARG
jgi:hypothetical protein